MSQEIIFLNLDEKVRDFISHSERRVDIFSPFITVDALSKCISSLKENVKVNVITRWRIFDFVTGSASLELFDFCSSLGLALYINPRLHLKTVVNDHQSLTLGSANITARGLGFLKPGNLEVLASIKQPSNHYLLFLEQIKSESSLVTNSVLLAFKEELKKLDKLKISEACQLSEMDEKLHRQARNRDFFLTSELPMCADIGQLYEVVKNPEINLDVETLATARHDIVNFSLMVNEYDTEEDFNQYLSTQFFSHPFIQALCSFIDRPRRFGEIRAWVQQVCTWLTDKTNQRHRSRCVF